MVHSIPHMVRSTFYSITKPFVCIISKYKKYKAKANILIIKKVDPPDLICKYFLQASHIQENFYFKSSLISSIPTYIVLHLWRPPEVYLMTGRETVQKNIAFNFNAYPEVIHRDIFLIFSLSETCRHNHFAIYQGHREMA